MKRILQFGFFILLFFVSSNIFAQADNTPLSDCGHPVGHDICKQAPTPSLCELDGYTFNTEGFTIDNDPVENYTLLFCGGGTVTMNNMWIGFTALGPNISLSFTNHGCVNAAQQCSGVQAGIFETDCKTVATHCNTLTCTNCVTSDFTLEYTGLIPGEFYYIMIDGCCGDVCGYTIDVLEGIPDPNFHVEIPPAELCYDDSNLFNTTTTLTSSIMPSNGNYIYEWTTEDGNFVGSTDGSTVDVDKIGTYVLAVREIVNCCKAADTAIIKLSQTAPVASVTDPIKLDCEHDMLELSGDYTYPSGGGAQPSDFVYSWQYQNGTVLDGGQNKKTYEVGIDDLQPGGVFVFSVYNKKTFCTDKKEVTVELDTVKPIAVPSPGGALSCLPGGSEIVVNGNDSDPVVPGGTLRYDWLDENGDLLLGDNSEYTISTGGTYTLLVTNPANGCTSTDDVVVTDARLLPTANAGSGAFIDCTSAHSTATLHAEGTIGLAPSGTVSYSWRDALDNEISTLQDFEVSLPGTYTLVITNGDNGCTKTDQIEVEDRTAKPTAAIVEPPKLTCDVQSVELVGSATGATNVKYEWRDSAGFVLGKAATQSVSATGTYTLIVKNADTGCEDMTTIDVTDNMAVPDNLNAYDAVLTCGTTSIDITGGNGSTSGVTYEWFNDNNTSIGSGETVSVTAPGTYTIVATLTSTGCTSSAEAVVTPDADLPNGNINTDATTITCDKQTVNIEVVSTTPGATYTWINAPAGASPSGAVFNTNVPGEYEVEIQNPANGCTITKKINIDEDTAPPLVDAGAPATLTCKDQQVQLFGTPKGASTNLEYTWSGPSIVSGVSDFNPMVDKPGTYTLTIKNTDTGCESSAIVDVAEDIMDPTVDLGPDKLIDCVNEKTLVGTNNTSQGGNFTYQWTNAGGSPLGTDIQYEATAMGDYTLLVTNTANGCTAQDTVHVDQDVVQPNNLAINANPLILTCETDMISTGVTFTDAASPKYVWSGPNGFTASTKDIDITEKGEYMLTITNEDNGCSTVSMVKISENKKEPGAHASDGKIPCDPGNFELQGTADESGVTYAWSGPEGTNTNPNWTIEQAGDYQLVVTGTNGCTSEVTVHVVPDDGVPTLEIDQPEKLTCEVTSINLNADKSTVEGGAKIIYNWFDPDGNPIFTASTIAVSEPGEYTLVGVNDANKCETTSTVTVEQDIVPPVADAGADLTLKCSDDTKTLDGTNSTPASGTLSYVWIHESLQAGDQPTLTTDKTGSFKLVVTDSENGCRAEDIAIITPDINKPIPVIQLPEIITCKQDMVTLNSQGSATAPSSSGNLSFEWFDENGVSLGTDPTVDVDKIGKYELYILDDSNGCSQSTSVVVVENKIKPKVVVDAPEILTCTVEEVPVLGEGSKTGDVSYTWERVDGAAGTVSNSSDINATVNKEGTYRLIVTDNLNGCSSELTVEVLADRELPEIETDVESELDCIIEEVKISGKVTNSTPATVFDYLWKGANGFTASTREAQVSEKGIYVLTVTNHETNCKDTSSIEVRKKPIIDGFAEFPTDESCKAANSGIVEFGETEGGTPPYMYSIDGGSTYTTNPVFTGLAPGSYNIVVQDSKGCEFDKTVEIAPFIPGVLDLGPDQTIILGDPAQITAETININGDTIVWSLDSLTGFDPIIYPTESTFLDATVYDENGCAATDRLAIFVKKVRPVYIPSGITPNGDGLNDVFTVFSQSAAVKEVKSMRIFDRWGELMFEQHNFPTDQVEYGWNGTLDGKHMNNAVFGYAIEVEFFDGSSEIYKGDVTILE